MAHDYPGDFGPQLVTEPNKDIEDINKEQYEKYTKEAEAQKQVI